VFDVCGYKDKKIIQALYLKNYTEEKIAETIKTMPPVTVRRYVFPLKIDRQASNSNYYFKYDKDQLGVKGEKTFGGEGKVTSPYLKKFCSKELHLSVCLYVICALIIFRTIHFEDRNNFKGG
jgi:hypothetical protein